MLKKLPIGIQTFKDIITGNYVYVDKTKEALELIENYRYIFLSRPRRFGKSLFLDTLKNIFEGNKDFFKGLYIYDKYDWNETYPVIKISWGGADYQTLGDLEDKAKAVLIQNQEKLGIKCKNDRANRCFEELIQNTYEKYNQKVVILIDEYDKPILNVIENKEQAKINREFIKGLYEVMKDNDAYIKFAFLTGVSKFSKASIFSGLNNLTDISLNPRFGDICGYTQNDLETTFKEHLEGTDLNRVKAWYNGYYFLKDKIYNPFDILQFINNGKIFKNYWFSSGTPSFLIKLIKENDYFLPKLSDLVVGEELMDSFDIENIKLEVLLYQSGYLTIEKQIIEDFGLSSIIKYKLKIPNLEVKMSLNNYIIEYLFNQSSGDRLRNWESLYRSLSNGKLEELEKTLKQIFASIPYNNYSNNYIQNYEGFYASVVYVYLQSLGIEVIGEDVTNLGRIDLTVKIEDKIYILEFKVVEEKAEHTALKQIKEKKYYEKYLNENKEIYLVGIEFSKKEKNIVSFEYEKVK